MLTVLARAATPGAKGLSKSCARWKRPRRDLSAPAARLGSGADCWFEVHPGIVGHRRVAGMAGAGRGQPGEKRGPAAPDRPASPVFIALSRLVAGGRTALNRELGDQHLQLLRQVGQGAGGAGHSSMLASDCSSVQAELLGRRGIFLGDGGH